MAMQSIGVVVIVHFGFARNVEKQNMKIFCST
jgi:hypothetical protein